MLIAIVNGQTVEQVGDYQTLFPNTSFPASGPTPEWMAENSCMYVTVWLPYDASTQYLESVAPYIDGDTVYTVIVAQMTPEMIDAMHQSQAANIAAQGKTILANTDWTAIASIADPAESDPYLTNRTDFLTYRSAVRAIVLNPAYDSVYPTAPIERWSNQPTGINSTIVTGTGSSTITL
jgi:hypothetical protein